MPGDRLMRIALTLCLVMALGGCSTISGWFDSDDEDARKPAPLEDITAEIRIKKLWSTSVGDGQGDTFNRLYPAIGDGVLYAAANDGSVAALNVETGKKIWRTDVDYQLTGAVGYGSGRVLLGTAGGKVLSLDAATGDVQWQVDVFGEVLAPPQTNGQVVVVQCYDGKLRGLSAEDGSELWAYESNVPVLTLRGTSTPAIYERAVIAAFANGRVQSFDLESGAIRWEARVAIAQGRSEIDRIVDIDGPVLVAGTTAYAVSYQGRVAAIDLGSGRKLWQEEASSYVGVDQGFGNVYVSDENGSVIAFHRNGQGIRWENPALEYRRLSAPRAVRGYVAVGDVEGYVHFLSQTDGHFVGRTKVDGNGVRASMLTHDNNLIVFGNSGKLVALQISTLDK